METRLARLPIDNLLSAKPDALEKRSDELAAEFARSPGWSDVIVPELGSSSVDRVANARFLLTLFPDDALLTVARGFAIDNPTLRFEVLGVLWAFVVGSRDDEREDIVIELAPHLEPGLVDQRRPERGFANPEQMELEHDYRICDETYLLLRRLRDRDFDDSDFEAMEEDERDQEVGQFVRRLDYLLASPKGAARKAARQPGGLAELTITGNFPDPYDDPATQEERDQSQIKKWAPANRDFLAVAQADTPKPDKAIFQVSNWLEMLSVILYANPADPTRSAFRPKQSLKRINLITHGNPGLIALIGSVDKEGEVLLVADGTDELTGPLDSDAAQAATNPAAMLPNGKPLPLSLRDRLHPKCEIYLLACNSGLAGSVDLLRDLKLLFKVKINAFADEIAYCPRLSPTQITDRSFTAKANCDNGSSKGFRHLKPDTTV